MTRKLVYIAGPVSAYGANHHNAVRIQSQNVARAMRIAEDVLLDGFFPFIPHLTHFFHIQARTDYGELYYEWDNAFLLKCDILFKYAPSPGADAEEALAWEHGIPVVHSFDELI